MHDEKNYSNIYEYVVSTIVEFPASGCQDHCNKALDIHTHARRRLFMQDEIRMFTHSEP